MTRVRAESTQVLAYVDDVTVGTALLEWGAALAQVTRCDLTVVYVEDTLALRAAALPITQALSHAGADWTPFDIGDVERGYRVQAARLREQAERLASRLALRCSLRTARGALAQAALSGTDESTFVVVAPAAARPKPGAASARFPAVLALWADGTPPQAVIRLAQRLARHAGGTCVERQVDAAELAAAVGSARADLIVLPRALAHPAVLARARQPVLLVGEDVTAGAAERAE